MSENIPLGRRLTLAFFVAIGLIRLRKVRVETAPDGVYLWGEYDDYEF